MGKFDDLINKKKQDYYIDLIERLVDDQKDFLGDEVALKQARKAPLRIDSQGNVEGFYGTGEAALETLRSYTENQEFYLNAIKLIIDRFKEFAGKKIALIAARQSPLEVGSGGRIKAYYGTGRKALTVLIGQYRDLLGRNVANIEVKKALTDISRDNRELIPSDVRPSSSSRSGIDFFIERLKDVFNF